MTAPSPHPEATNRLLRLSNELSARMIGLDRIDVVDALVAGTLHPAIRIDWEEV